MPVFGYRWPDGDVSIVQATSRDEAVFVLDELGPARREKLVSLSGLFVTLRLKDHIGDAYDPRPFEVDQFHDAIVDKIGGMFPRLQEVLDNDFDTEDSFLDAINKAVQAEKEAGE